MSPGKLVKYLFVFCLVSVCLAGTIRAADTFTGITVVMPSVRPPFDKVFDDILSGIRTLANGNTNAITIDDTTTVDDIRSILDKQTTRTAIGLGNKAKTLLEPLESEYHIIYGASFLNPDEEPADTTGISLTPDPAAIFTWIRTLTPEITHIEVVYNQDYNGWLIQLATAEARHRGLTLISHPVDTVRDAALEFKTILSSTDPATHAIWLMQRDPSLDEKAVVPDILAQAWSKNYVIFSSNPAHVPRGALFALYPDNEKMGISLAKLAMDTSSQGILPLSDLLIAVNVRTASHIGRNFSRREEQQFDLIFPSR